jgi:hypothetical protein
MTRRRPDLCNKLREIVTLLDESRPEEYASARLTCSPGFKSNPSR